MKFSKLRSTLTGLRESNNTLVITNLCTAIISIILVIMLYNKNERVVVVPPNLTTISWIDYNEGSTPYMHSWAAYIASLLGNANINSVKFVKSSLEPFLSSTNRGKILQTIDDEVGRLQKDRVTASFTPINVSTDPKAVGQFYVEGDQTVTSITGTTKSYTVTYIVTVFIRGYKPVIENIQLIPHTVDTPSQVAAENDGNIPEGSDAERQIKESRINDKQK